MGINRSREEQGNDFALYEVKMNEQSGETVQRVRKIKKEESNYMTSGGVIIGGTSGCSTLRKKIPPE